MKTLTLVLVALMSMNAISSAGREGGGGDASEARVNEIRSDILDWIKKGGSNKLALPDGISLNEYNQKMSDLLKPQAVVVSFVKKDDPKEEELQVMVDGKPKTCRGFYSRVTNKPNILCNIERFQATNDSNQYRLIHHEYAGLAYLEKNDGAASDYSISNQITDFLKLTKVYKLSVVRERLSTNEKSYLIEMPKYLGTNFHLIGAAENNETGVCTHLGFEKFIRGSAVYDEVEDFTIYVDLNGIPVKSGKTRPLKSLVCLNKVDKNPTIPSLTTVKSPLHYEAKQPIVGAAENDESGVCRYLGFNGYLKGSAAYEKERLSLAIVLDKNGNVLVARQTYLIKELICQNP